MARPINALKPPSTEGTFSFRISPPLPQHKPSSALPVIADHVVPRRPTVIRQPLAPIQAPANVRPTPNHTAALARKVATHATPRTLHRTACNGSQYRDIDSDDEPLSNIITRRQARTGHLYPTSYYQHTPTIAPEGIWLLAAGAKPCQHPTPPIAAEGFQRNRWSSENRTTVEGARIRRRLAAKKAKLAMRNIQALHASCATGTGSYVHTHHPSHIRQHPHLPTDLVQVTHSVKYDRPHV